MNKKLFVLLICVALVCQGCAFMQRPRATDEVDTASNRMILQTVIDSMKK